MASSFKITFIGTGGSWPTPGRGLPAVVVQVDEIINLFDCGEGTQKQLMKSPISFMGIDNVFITHFHGDHFLGILGMIQSMSFNNRQKPLNVFGPKGAIKVLSNAFNVGYFNLKFDLIVNELDYDKKYDFEKFSITTFKNDHTVPAMSYKISEYDLVKIDRDKADSLGVPPRKLEELREKGSIEVEGNIFTLDQVSAGIKKGRSIVYTGDTRPMEGMKQFVKGADVLIHDTTTDSSLDPAVNDFGHSSSRQAAEIARDGGVGKLFLFHYSPRYASVETLYNEAKRIFPNVECSKEMLEYEVPAHSVLR